MNAAELLGLAVHTPELPGAVCVDASARALFDETAGACTTAVLQEAAWACARCPALAACRAWVKGLPPRQRPRGVVGGLAIGSTGRVTAALPV